MARKCGWPSCGERAFVFDAHIRKPRAASTRYTWLIASFIALKLSTLRVIPQTKITFVRATIVLSWTPVALNRVFMRIRHNVAKDSGKQRHRCLTGTWIMGREDYLPRIRDSFVCKIARMRRMGYGGKLSIEKIIPELISVERRLEVDEVELK